MDEALHELVEKDRISERIHTLFCATDIGDWDLVRGCFAPEVHFDMTAMGEPGPASRTPAQIAAAWEEGLRPLSYVHHQVGNLIVRLTGRSNRARATCHGTATHYRRGSVRTIVGTYDLALRKHGDRWEIDLFRFHLGYQSGDVDG